MKKDGLMDPDCNLTVIKRHFLSLPPVSASHQLHVNDSLLRGSAADGETGSMLWIRSRGEGRVCGTGSAGDEVTDDDRESEEWETQAQSLHPPVAIPLHLHHASCHISIFLTLQLSTS